MYSCHEGIRRLRDSAARQRPAAVGCESAPLCDEHFWKSNITNQTFQPEASFLLRDVANGAPVGMLVTKSWEADAVATGVRDAYFMIIGTLQDYRKRGVASALIGHALRAAADQGYSRASLSVDSASPTEAFGVYEKAGFVPTKRSVRWARDSIPHAS